MEVTGNGADGLLRERLFDRSGTFHSRNPFPVGGVVEDPATGAAAVRATH
ncbi:MULTISPECIES: PhzF family phenazine biosynthesis protein [Microbacterium]|nr:PhzF family phenazine biosynthesis protein [Microbacterium sp. EYE_512]